MRHLHFRSVRGDLQEGNVYAKRLRDYASRCQFPHFPSTKSGFLCAFALRNPHFQAFRAQNRGFCALLPSGTLIFGHFEHKIEVFVLFWPSGPLFSGISSTKSPFLCSFTKLDVGLGDFPAERGIVAPAQPILPLTLPPLHLLAAAPARHFTCGAASPARRCTCSPLHLRNRCASCLCSLSHLRSRYYRSLSQLHLTARAG